MIRHLVFLRLKGSATAETRATLQRELDGLRAHVEGMGAVEWHRNVSVEGDMTRGYTDMFEVAFRDAAARDAYLPHPEHRRVGALLVAQTDGGRDGIFVCDVEVPDA